MNDTKGAIVAVLDFNLNKNRIPTLSLRLFNWDLCPIEHRHSREHKTQSASQHNDIFPLTRPYEYPHANKRMRYDFLFPRSPTSATFLFLFIFVSVPFFLSFFYSFSLLPYIGSTPSRFLHVTRTGVRTNRQCAPRKYFELRTYFAMLFGDSGGGDGGEWWSHSVWHYVPHSLSTISTAMCVGKCPKY